MPELFAPLQFLESKFTLTTAQLVTIASLFRQEMANGLVNQPSSLAMLPSFLTRPGGLEKGLYLALDFGGTNVRALVVELMGNESYRVLRRRSVPLRDPEGKYDFTSRTATATELFAFLASQLVELVDDSSPYYLGHSFSFPCKQIDVNSAVLLRWTKEIKTKGMEGKDVTILLTKALHSYGARDIRPVALLNDSVSALMAAAYSDNETDIGSICGTGHNTCYLEPNPPWGDRPMYINIESGNFNKIVGNQYDELLDETSEKPGAAKLEKMCSGRYIGELFRFVIHDLSEQGNFHSTIAWNQANITGADLALILGDQSPDLGEVFQWLQSQGEAGMDSIAERRALQSAAFLIVKRSAQLVATTLSAVVLHVDPLLERRHAIAIDGSLYEKMPGYAQEIRLTLDQLFATRSKQVRVYLTKDGSGIGAAVAAATAAQEI